MVAVVGSFFSGSTPVRKRPPPTPAASTAVPASAHHSRLGPLGRDDCRGAGLSDVVCRAVGTGSPAGTSRSWPLVTVSA